MRFKYRLTLEVYFFVYFSLNPFLAFRSSWGERMDGGWRMLVTQLQERLGGRDCDDPMKGLVPLREFLKFDPAFPAYLKGRRNKRLLCVCSSFIFTFQKKLHLIIIIVDIITVGIIAILFFLVYVFDSISRL